MGHTASWQTCIHFVLITTTLVKTHLRRTKNTTTSLSHAISSECCVSNHPTCDNTLLTKLSSSGSSLKKGLCSRSCWCTKFSMSTSKLADVMHSDPCVACSHFSNNKASRGNNGCLRRKRREALYVSGCISSVLSYFIFQLDYVVDFILRLLMQELELF